MNADRRRGHKALIHGKGASGSVVAYSRAVSRKPRGTALPCNPPPVFQTILRIVPSNPDTVFITAETILGH